MKINRIKEDYNEDPVISYEELENIYYALGDLLFTMKSEGVTEIIPSMRTKTPYVQTNSGRVDLTNISQYFTD